MAKRQSADLSGLPGQPRGKKPPPSDGQRRRFSEQFKAQIVALVLDDGLTMSAVAEARGLVYATVARWVHKERAARRAAAAEHSPPPTPAEQAAEIRELRAKLERSELKVEILKKAAAFLAEDQP